MKPLKIVFIAIGLILGIAILRETGTLELNFYRSSNNTSSHSTWNSSSSTVSWGPTKPRPTVTKDDLSVIIVSGKDTIYKNLNKLLPIIVKVKEVHTGRLWTPLYKSASFSVVGTPEFDPRQKLKGEYTNGAYKMGMSGEFILNGEILIEGLCSYREARKLVNKEIAENFTAKIKDHLFGQSDDLLQAMANAPLASNAQVSK